MAVVLLFRVAIVLTPIAYRYVAAGGATYSGAIEHGLLQYWERLHDPSEDPDALTAEMSAGYPESGAAFLVTDWTGSFELRKLQWRLSRAPSGGTIEDQDVMTFHFLKTSGGTPAAWVDGTDLPAVETALGTFWGSIKDHYYAWVHSDQYRWYKDGPAFWQLSSDSSHYVPVTPNPSIRVTEVDVAGTYGGSNSTLPPQVALTITEKTSARRSWGRFYLPAIISSYADADGRLLTAQADTLVGAAVTFYNSCRSSGVTPVVFTIPKLERPTKGGGTLPADGGTAHEIISLQMDNLFDVIRRRRYDAPTYRKVTALT